MRTILCLLVVLVSTPFKSANALDDVPTFCSAIENEKSYIESIVKNIKSLQTGYTPQTLHHNKQFHQTEFYQNRDNYSALIEETLENVRKMAKLREETIYLVHPPESGNEYQRCCVMTCSYLSKNRNVYQ